MFYSSFDKIGANPLAVAVTLELPDWYQGTTFRALAAPYRVLRIPEPDEFAIRYARAILNHLNPKDIHDKLVEFNPDCILVDRGGVCSVGPMIARWLKYHLDVDIKDFNETL